MKLTLLTHCPPRFRPILVTIAAFLMHSCNGAADIAGNLVPYIASYIILRKKENMSAGSSAWIPTLVIGSKNICAALAGWLYQRFGCHPLLPIDSILIVFASLSTCWAIQKSVEWVYLTMTLFGIGTGAMLVPTLALPLKWCPQRKGLIAGITLSSTGVGTAAYAYIETVYANPSNQQTNTIVNGLHLFDHADLLERIPQMFVVLGIILAVIHVLSLPFLYDPWSVTVYESIEEQRIPLKTVFASSTYIFLLSSYFLINASFTLIMAYYKVFGATIFDDDYFMGIVAVLASLFNIAGRVFWGYITDHISFQFAGVMSQGAFTILMYLFYLCHYGGKAMFAVWMCAMYFCYASESSTFPAGLAKTFGMDSFGTAWGVMLTSSGLASFLLAIIADQALEAIGFLGVMIISGSFSFAAVILLLFIHRTDLGEALS